MADEGFVKEPAYNHYRSQQHLQIEEPCKSAQHYAERRYRFAVGHPNERHQQRDKTRDKHKVSDT
jgi:hypothetical protein